MIFKPGDRVRCNQTGWFGDVLGKTVIVLFQDDDGTFLSEDPEQQWWSNDHWSICEESVVDKVLTKYLTDGY